MHYAILCYDSERLVGGWSKERDAAVMTQSLAVKAVLEAQGKMGPTLRLMPTTTATTIRAGNEPVVLDGPFAETKEQLLGFYVVDCESLDEVIEVAKKFLHGSGALEIRPIQALWNVVSSDCSTKEQAPIAPGCPEAAPASAGES